MKKNKLVVGVISALVVQLSLCSIAFADPSVSATQDGINVTKKAEWTKYDGKSLDKDGNPYAKVTFTLDTTNAKTEIEDIISKGGDTDVVVLLDNSVSMNYADNKDKFADAKAAANKFAADMLAIKEYKVRVGLVSFATTAQLQMELGTDLNTFKAKVEPLKAGGGTNIQHAVWHAQNMLKKSTAKNKVIVMLSDGHANGKITFKGDDIATTGANDDERAQNQVAIARKLIPDLKVVGIGYDTRDKDEDALAKLTTEDANGKKLFFKANALGGNVASSIQNVFDKITEVVTYYVIGNSLTDKIPAEFNLVDGTITCNDAKVKAYLSDDKKTIQWNWGENKLEKKKYEMSFIMALDKAKTPQEYFKNKTEINSNGEKIDPTIDTLGSSKVCYGSKNIIQLKSPTLPLSEELLTGKLVEDDNKLNAPADSKDNTPQTGDNFTVAIVALLAASGVVVVMLGHKLRKRI